jgi:hypothetical protein
VLSGSFHHPVSSSILYQYTVVPTGCLPKPVRFHPDSTSTGNNFQKDDNYRLYPRGARLKNQGCGNWPLAAILRGGAMPAPNGFLNIFCRKNLLLIRVVNFTTII